MSLQIDFGIAIQQLRKQRGLSQERLALEADIDRRYMSDVENGKRNISLDIMERIARQLGIEVSELIRHAEEVSKKTLAIATIIGIIVSHNSANILSCSLLVGVAVILHNVLGLTLGYVAGRLLGLPHDKRTAISIEVGMQNSGLATSLAATHFAMFPLAAVPGAIFSTWHNFSGSIAASVFRKLNNSVMVYKN